MLEIDKNSDLFKTVTNSTLCLIAAQCTLDKIFASNPSGETTTDEENDTLTILSAALAWAAYLQGECDNRQLASEHANAIKSSLEAAFFLGKRSANMPEIPDVFRDAFK